MKLRIFENSVRIRLTKLEVEILSNGKPVNSTLTLGLTEKDALKYESCLTIDKTLW
ncbi:MAG: hypothetical protein AB8G05_27765 [Oligoflexales bacterium]